MIQPQRFIRRVSARRFLGDMRRNVWHAAGRGRKAVILDAAVARMAALLHPFAMPATAELRALPAEERLTLIADLWDSLAGDPGAVRDGAAESAEVRRRLDAHRADPATALEAAAFQRRVDELLGA
jgi:putative addiction module component (TIGR02574 family)